MNEKFKELIPKALEGDEKAYEELYNLTKKPAFFIALSITGNHQDAMDILQDSYIKAFKTLPSVHIPEQFDGWVCRIVSNESKNYIKKKKPILFSDINENFDGFFNEEETDASRIPHEAADNAEINNLIMQILSKLDEDKRLIIIMYYYQSMKTAEIAETLDIPLTTVNYRLLAAKKEIKAEVEKLEKEGTKLYTVPLFFILPTILNNVSGKSVAPAYHSLAMGNFTNTAFSPASGLKSPAFGTKTGFAKFVSTTAGKITAVVTSVTVVSAIAVTIALTGGRDKKKDSYPNIIETISHDSLPDTSHDLDSEKITTDDFGDSEDVTVTVPETETEVAFEDMPLYEQLYVKGNENVPNKAKIKQQYSSVYADFTIEYELEHISDSYSAYDAKSIISNIKVEEYSNKQYSSIAGNGESDEALILQVMAETLDGITITVDDSFMMTITNEKNNKTVHTNNNLEYMRAIYTWAGELYADDISQLMMNDMSSRFEAATDHIVSELKDPFGEVYSKAKRDFIDIYDYDIVKADGKSETYIGTYSSDEDIQWEINISKADDNHYSYSIKRSNDKRPNAGFDNSYVSYDIEWID